ncbi:hypothetical protein FACS1894186_6410 [Alphaproteobacteria bacterium]|nr:hypothetical protein FACS1894186_6410 [Alphaproteobacteria bacterium]
MERKISLVLAVLLVVMTTSAQLWQRSEIAGKGARLMLPVFNRNYRSGGGAGYVEFAYENIIPLSDVRPEGGRVSVYYDHTGRARYAGEGSPADEPPLADEAEADRPGAADLASRAARLAYKVARPKGFRSGVGNSARLVFGAEKFYFPPDRADFYRAARYAVLRVNPQGRSVLVDLADENFQSVGGD